jgi:C4-dicarboxylate transporter, DctM subunit
LEPNTILLVVILLLLLLLAARVPVAFALINSSAVGIVLLRGSGHAHSTLEHFAYSTTGRNLLIIVPFFLAMGIFVQSSRLGESIFELAHRFLGRIHGGMAIGTVLACAAFAAISGSSAATVLSIGRLAMREMDRLGYSRILAAGVVGAAGTLGILIPPSIILVIYAVVAGESVGAMLLAGIVPGVLSGAIYIGVIYVWARRSPGDFGRRVDPENEGKYLTNETDARAPISPAAGLLQLAIIVGIVVGGIFSGTVTVSEAAAVAALVALAIMLYDLVKLRRRILPQLVSSIRELTQLNGMTFALLIGAGLFSTFMVLGRYGRTFADYVADLPVSPTVVVIALLLLFIPLGMVLDGVSMVLISVPIMYPVVTGLGYDGIWFGILLVKMVEIGLVTPPLGINAYILAGAGPERLGVEDAFRGVLRFVPYDLATVAILFVFPTLVLWLPAQV